MNPTPLTRRDFVKNAALATAALQLPAVLRAADAPAAGPGPAAAAGDEVELHWLEGPVPPAANGVTWGVPWPRGRLAKDTTFALRTAAGAAVPVQSWPLACWPDGSLKWTAHAVGAESGQAEKLLLAAGDAGGAGAAGAGERDGRRRRGRHRRDPLPDAQAGRGAHRVDHARRPGNRARRPAGRIVRRPSGRGRGCGEDGVVPE